ncbi:MAG: threonyl-tRNA synthetase editing domain-containing protein, partial [Metallosphaera sp.]
MIILLIHSSEFYFKIREKAITRAEEPSLSNLEVQNALVVFTTVEKEDEDEEVVENAVREIIDVRNKVNASSVVIYPYAHLSSNLASPEVAVEILKRLEAKLRDSGLEVYRAPFGWYKEFKIKCLGHPLSELSRRIRAGSLNYEKSKEIEYCEKFGFPSSPHATFIRKAVLEWIKFELQPRVITESEYPYS